MPSLLYSRNLKICLNTIKFYLIAAILNVRDKNIIFRMPDEELKAGATTNRILVPHPAITGEENIFKNTRIPNKAIDLAQKKIVIII